MCSPLGEHGIKYASAIVFPTKNMMASLGASSESSLLGARPSLRDSLRQVSVAELTPQFFPCFVSELGITKLQLLPRKNQWELAEWEAEYASFSSHFP